MTFLAEMMKEKYGIPYIRVSYFGIEDMAKALYDVAEHFSDQPEIMDRAREFVRNEVEADHARDSGDPQGSDRQSGRHLRGRRLQGLLPDQGPALPGHERGSGRLPDRQRKDYDTLRDMCDDGTIILDDANPLELSKYIIEKKADLFIGGVKERPIAYKLGIGFCDHNHERKMPLAGFDGMLHFAREIHTSVTSPVWQFVPARGVLKTGEKDDHDDRSSTRHAAATQNACKLCSPLGAALVFKGIAGSVPLLHGSQGCSTYIRRYLISHFKEPIDIACSNFGEQTAIFGGGANMKLALDNIIAQYAPAMIGVATTCLAETIGDDVPMFIHLYKVVNAGEPLPAHRACLHAQLPGHPYAGFSPGGPGRGARRWPKRSVIGGCAHKTINLFPGMVSPADLRHLKEIAGRLSD